MRRWASMREVQDAARFPAVLEVCSLPRNPPIHGRYFVTGQDGVVGPGQDSPGRRYTIREMLSNRMIRTVGQYYGYETRQIAESAAYHLPSSCSAAAAEAVRSMRAEGLDPTVDSVVLYSGISREDVQTVFEPVSA